MFGGVTRRRVRASIGSSDGYGDTRRSWYACNLGQFEIEDQPRVGTLQGIPFDFDRVIIRSARADDGGRCDGHLMKMDMKHCRGRRVVQVFWMDVKEGCLKRAVEEDGRAQNRAGPEARAGS